MREPGLSDADAARLKELTHAPLVEAEMLAIAAHVDHGTLPDDRLDTLLGWAETSPREQREKYKRLAAAAIHRQHKGRYVARGQAWLSDGTTLRGEMR